MHANILRHSNRLWAMRVRYERGESTMAHMNTLWATRIHCERGECAMGHANTVSNPFGHHTRVCKSLHGLFGLSSCYGALRRNLRQMNRASVI